MVQELVNAGYSCIYGRSSWLWPFRRQSGCTTELFLEVRVWRRRTLCLLEKSSNELFLITGSDFKVEVVQADYCSSINVRAICRAVRGQISEKDKVIVLNHRYQKQHVTCYMLKACSYPQLTLLCLFLCLWILFYFIFSQSGFVPVATARLKKTPLQTWKKIANVTKIMYVYGEKDVEIGSPSAKFFANIPSIQVRIPVTNRHHANVWVSLQDLC